MSTVAIDHERRVLELRIPTAAIVGLAALVHGPLDVGVTLLAWHFESNPVVLLLGVEGFLLAKVAGLVGLGLLWWRVEPSGLLPARIERGAELVMYALAGLLIAIGVAHVALNLWVIAAVAMQGVVA